jgi:hypothetical protein
MTSYNKGYYEQNKKRIADYNKARRENNPEIILKEKERYKLRADAFKISSKVQFLKGKMAWNMLSKKKQQGILADISKKLGIEIK